MSPISFVPKAGFKLFDRLLTILNVTKRDDQTILEVMDEDGEVHIQSQEYLLDQYLKRNLRAADFIKEEVERRSQTRNPLLKLLSDLGENARKEGERNAGLLNAINEEGGFHRGNASFWEKRYPELCKEHGFKRAPDRSTIQRWLRKAQGCTGLPLQLLLAPKNELKGGRGKTRMSPEVEKVVETCVQDIYLSSGNTPLTECHEELVKRIARANEFRYQGHKLKPISYGQLTRYVQGIDAYEIHASKFGRDSAGKEFRVSRSSNSDIQRPLQRVEVDHTPLDIFVVDDAGEVLGRAYLTIIVDKRTRAILGYNLGFEGPSTISVLRALKHAVNPKTYLQEKFPQVKNKWPMHGLIQLLAMDNGTEFHAVGFKATVFDMGIAQEFAYMPRKMPFYKGLVEWIQGYLNRSIASGQPGATESHHWQRNKERPPEEYAVHTIDSLHEMLHIWICDIYHPKVQKKLGTSPYKKWQELTSLMPVRLPASQEHLDLACTIPTTRRIQAYGVEVCYLRTFSNDELERLYRQYGRTTSVEVRFKPHKLDKVWVKDPGTKSWIVVENRDSETRNTTAWQQEQAQKIIRAEMNEHGEVILRAEAQEKLRAIGRNLLSEKTMTKRRKALKLLGLLPTTSLVDEPDEMPKSEQVSKRGKAAIPKAASNSVKPKPKQEQVVTRPRPTPKPAPPVSGGYFSVEAMEVM